MASPNSLSVAAGGFQCLEQRQLQNVIAYLLQQIAGLSSMTPNQLANSASGFQCVDTNGLLLIQTFLLSQLAGSSTQAAGVPVTPPANTNGTAFYVDTNTGILYYWNVANQAWQ